MKVCCALAGMAVAWQVIAAPPSVPCSYTLPLPGLCGTQLNLLTAEITDEGNDLSLRRSYGPRLGWQFHWPELIAELQEDGEFRLKAPQPSGGTVEFQPQEGMSGCFTPVTRWKPRRSSINGLGGPLIAEGPLYVHYEDYARSLIVTLRNGEKRTYGPSELDFLADRQIVEGSYPLQKVESPDKKNVYYVYDNEDRPSKIVGPGYQSVELTWQEQQLARVTMNGRSIKYAYDEGQLSCVDYPGRRVEYRYGKPPFCPPNVVRRYAIDGADRISATYSAQAKVTVISSPWHKTNLYEVDCEGNQVTAHTDKGCWTCIADYDKTNIALEHHDEANPRANFIERREWSDCLLQQVSLTDASGTTTRSFSYDDRGNAIEERCDEQVRTYGYDIFNYLLWEGDKRTKTEYTYVPGTCLLAEKLTYGDGVLVQSETYEYDREGEVIASSVWDGLCTQEQRIIRNDHGLPIEINGLQSRRFLYDKYNQVVEEERIDEEGKLATVLHYRYDDAGRLISQTNALGQETNYHYNEWGNCLLEQHPSGLRIHHTYDALGRCVATTREAVNEDSLTTQYRYDAWGLLIEEVDEYGSATHYTYDNLGHETSRTFPPIRTGENTWSSPQHSQAQDSGGRIVWKRDGLGRETRQTYRHGQVTMVSYPDGTQESYSYSPEGHLLRERSRKGLITCYERDALGQAIVIHAAGFGPVFHHYVGSRLIKTITPDGQETHFSYDSAGRLIREERGESLMEYRYDTLGRRSEEIIWTSDTEYQVTRHEYDLLNRLIEKRVEDSSGQLFSHRCYHYDVAGNRTHESIYDGTQWCTNITEYNSFGEPVRIQDAEDNVTIIEYERAVPFEGQFLLLRRTTDPKGRILEELLDAERRIVHTEGFNVLGQQLYSCDTFYDLAGRKVRELHQGLDEAYAIAWEYDAGDRVTTVRHAVGSGMEQCERFTYNALGQLSTRTRPNGTQIRYVYSGCGRLSALQGPDLFYRYSYDLMGRLVRVRGGWGDGQCTRIYSSAGLQSETLMNGLTLSYKYDRANRLIHVTLPDGSGIDYERDACHLRAIHRADYSHRYLAINGRGQVLEEELAGNHGRVQYSYDGLGRCQRIDHHAYQHLESRYDQAGNLISLSDRDSDGDLTQCYTYDDLNQLTSEPDHTYKYDALGNLRIYDGVSTEVDELNQIRSVGDCRLTYDGNGRIIRKEKGDQITCYRYDCLDRLVQVETDGQVSTFAYDHEGRRLKSGGQCFFYIGAREIGAARPDGTLIELRVLGKGLGADIGAAVAIECNGELSVPLHDHRSCIRCLLHEDAAMENRRYSAFGLADPSICPYGFLSKRHDVSGLIYFGKRYYDPELGRFLTRDPAGYIDGPNLYAYAHNSPLAHGDLYGQWTFAIRLFMWGLPMLGKVWNLGQSKSKPAPLPPPNQREYAALGNVALAYVGYGIEAASKLSWDWSGIRHFTPLTSSFGQMLQGTWPTHTDLFCPEPAWGMVGKYYPNVKDWRVMVVNGYDTSLHETIMRAQWTAHRMQRKVWYYHVPPRGLVADAMCFFAGRAGIPCPSILKATELMSGLLSITSQMQLLVLPHSYGGEVTAQALRRLGHGARMRTSVVTFGSAAILESGIDCKKARNFISKRDPIPSIASFCSPSGLARHPDVVMLDAGPNASWFDHAYDGPTYSSLYGDICDTFIWEHPEIE